MTNLLSMPRPAADRRAASLKIASVLHAGGVTSEELSSFDPEVVYLELNAREIVREWANSEEARLFWQRLEQVL